MQRFLALLLGFALAALPLLAAELHYRAQERREFALVFDPPGVKYGLPLSKAGLGRGWVPEAPPPPREPGRLRVLCLGDSVTYGVNVPAGQAWPARLGELLEASFGSGRVEVFNLGINGWDAGQVVALARSRLADWEPDLLLWGNYQNDFFPTLLLRLAKSDRSVFVGEVVPPQSLLLPLGPSRWLLGHSALFRQLQGLRQARVQARDGQGPPRKRWFARQLALLREWSEESGVPVGVLVIPSHALADPALCRERLSAWRCRALAHQYHLDRALVEASGLPWVDGLAALRADGAGDYFPRRSRPDPDHPGARAHRVWAEAVAPLAEELLAGAGRRAGGRVGPLGG